MIFFWSLYIYAMVGLTEIIRLSKLNFSALFSASLLTLHTLYSNRLSKLQCMYKSVANISIMHISCITVSITLVQAYEKSTIVEQNIMDLQKQNNKSSTLTLWLGYPGLYLPTNCMTCPATV